MRGRYADGHFVSKWYRSFPRRVRQFGLCFVVLYVICLVVYFYNTSDTASAQIRGIDVPPKRPVFLGPQNSRQKAVQEAFHYAWKNYKHYAWGQDELAPLSNGSNNWFGLGLTIIDAIDTAMVMRLDKEVEEATKWIRDDMDFNKAQNAGFMFENTIRNLGGLLSAYHLSGDKLFLEKAEELGHRLMPAFTKSFSVFPLKFINVATGEAYSEKWGFGTSSLAAVTSLQMEFRELSRLTGNFEFETTAFKASKRVHSIGCEAYEGLCRIAVVPNLGYFQFVSEISVGARADSFYEYLLKQWIQTGKTINWLRQDYEKAMAAMMKFLLKESEPNHISFLGYLQSNGTFVPSMDHLSCFIAGTLALGWSKGMPDSHLAVAKQIAEACHHMYETPSGIAPETTWFNMDKNVESDFWPDKLYSVLRPEAVESWFYLYRVTGDKKYQEWGWEMFQSIEKNAKLPSGYAGLMDVNNPKPKINNLETFFFAETLKYLYLLLADDQSELPLDQWVFNTEAHLLPVRTY